MNNENKGFFNKLRYTGWGRILTFIIIILISAAVGFAILESNTSLSEKDITKKYIENDFLIDLNRKLNSHDVSIENLVNYKIDFKYENEEEEVLARAFHDKNLEDIEEDKGNLIFLRGKFIKDAGLELENNNIEDENIKNQTEEMLNVYFSEAKQNKEVAETINSSDEDYLDKVSKASSFTPADEEDARYVKGDYGSFEPSTMESGEIYDEDGEKLIANIEDGAGYYYPTGDVIIYNYDKSPVQEAEFIVSVKEADVISNPFIIYNIERLVLLGFLPAIALAALLVLIFNALSDYEKMKNIKYIRFMDRWYLDISIISCFAIFTMIILILQGVFNEFYISGILMTNFIAKIVALSLASIMGLMLFSYGLFVIKVLYNNGIIYSIKNKTLVAWAIRKIVGLAKRIEMFIKSQIKDVGTIGLLGTALVTLILAMIVIFFSALRGNMNAWFFFGLIALVGTFLLIKSFVKNIKNINDKSSEIAKGNYDVKVDETMPYFKNIAHNFNTIGDNLTTAVEEQVKAERMRTELITNVSHDLKTPLTSIINYSKILIDEEASPEEKQEYAKVVYEKSLKLKTLIEDLFQISKATTNNIEFEKEKLDFSALTLQGIGEWKDYFEEKNLTIVFNKPDYPIVLELDGNKTYRVLDNIMSNIYKYAQENTRVYMDLRESLESVELTIKNISAYELNISADELMERFTRGDKSRTTDGSGLGLSIASSLVEGQGGRFNIEIDGDLFKVIVEFPKE
ncbi:HAMP domain-containing sensor histidine kinase [Miniphocaeibacter halophilus]|uniref:Uncharacterized protein n=1 Tax=Miniphocaeibacter halophilus TaxID=2931922 RepID=A0AC61N222_9FIRM|nr:histidine kinase dimerization/phospho-acceptor domain-containing protein [Miniphocaeibacter halophilus]QQK08771.1 hypothetical protein JFY71_04360 [Miniphocaeibacter halophilus]